jgi:hypothetical protein
LTGTAVESCLLYRLPPPQDAAELESLCARASSWLWLTPYFGLRYAAAVEGFVAAGWRRTEVRGAAATALHYRRPSDCLFRPRLCPEPPVACLAPVYRRMLCGTPRPTPACWPAGGTSWWGQSMRV